MKKRIQKLMTCSALATSLLLFSCGEDEPVVLDGPVIQVAATVGTDILATNGEVTAGETVSFSISVTADGVFNTLRVKGDYTETYSRTPGTTPTTFSQVFEAVTIEDQIDQTLTLTFEAVDDQNIVTSTDFSFKVIAPPSPAARVYSETLLAAPIQDDAGANTSKTSETFFSTNTGAKYTMNDVLASADPLSADIDFGYFYGTEKKATLSDPANYPFAYGQAAWGTRNSTTFQLTDLTVSQFTEIVTFADIEETFSQAKAADNDPGLEIDLAKDQVLAFTTDADKPDGKGDKRGFILIGDIVGTNGSDASITLTIIVEEESIDD
jgi:hypothetical protein